MGLPILLPSTPLPPHSLLPPSPLSPLTRTTHSPSRARTRLSTTPSSTRSPPTSAAPAWRAARKPLKPHALCRTPMACTRRKPRLMGVTTMRRATLLFWWAYCMTVTRSCRSTPGGPTTHTSCLWRPRSRRWPLPRSPPSSPPRHVAPLMIAAGGSHALCLTDEGELFAWGAGARGQLGLGAAVSQCDAPRAVVCGERVNVRSPRWSERPSCRWCAAGATAPACPLRATCTRGARAPTASLARDSTWTARSSQWCSTSCAGRTSAAWIQDVRMSRRLPADRTTRCS